MARDVSEHGTGPAPVRCQNPEKTHLNAHRLGHGEQMATRFQGAAARGAAFQAADRLRLARRAETDEHDSQRAANVRIRPPQAAMP